jgi:hypothetical protein
VTFRLLIIPGIPLFGEINFAGNVDNREPAVEVNNANKKKTATRNKTNNIRNKQRTPKYKYTNKTLKSIFFWDMTPCSP